MRRLLPLSVPQKLWETERGQPVDTARGGLLPAGLPSALQWKMKPCKPTASKLAEDKVDSRLRTHQPKESIHGSNAPDCLTVLRENYTNSFQEGRMPNYSGEAFAPTY